MSAALTLLALALASGSLRAEEPEPLPITMPPPATPPVVERFEIDGYLRTRGYHLYNLDLNRGPTPSSGEPIFPYAPSGSEHFSGGNLRLRMDAAIRIVPEISVHLRVDGLDNVPLGSTPAGWPADRWAPSSYATTSQDAPTSGVNSFGDSIALKRAWGEALTPFGAFMVGRMGMPMWGVGMLANPGDDLDDDFDQNVDRVGFATTAFDHFLGVSYDWNAVGPSSASASGSLWGQDIDLEPGDDVHTVSVALLRHLDEDAVSRRKRAGKPAFRYGAYVTWRSQELDVPSYWLGGLDEQDGSIDESDLVDRGFQATAGDLFLDLLAPRWGLQLELAHVRGSVADLSLIEGVQADEVTLTQTGAVLRAWADLLPEQRLTLAAEAGYASGDDAPGMGVAPSLDQLEAQAGDLDGPQFSLPGDSTIDNFRFHPNYHVDLILWRQIIGTVTDAVYLRPALKSQPHERLDLELAWIHSRAAQPSSTPSGEAHLGDEVDISARWDVWHGLHAQLQYGLLLPGPGFRNLQHDLEPTPAHAVRALVAFTF
jgi:uncharacterized protein (TIGR04551 family)